MVKGYVSPARLRLQRHIISHFFAPVRSSLDLSRAVSTTSAINRGLRDTQSVYGTGRSKKPWQEREAQNQVGGRRERQHDDFAARTNRGNGQFRNRAKDHSGAYGREDKWRTGPGPASRNASDIGEVTSHRKPGSDDFSSHHPISVPYTTAASEFLYGAHTVLAALKAQRRKLYTLYFGRKEAAGKSAPDNNQPAAQSVYGQIVSHSNLPDLKVNRNADRALLDKISANRNHQNVALECSRLPFPPLASLGYPTSDTATQIPSIPLTYAEKRTPEDIAIDGDNPNFNLPRGQFKAWHKPLVVFIDGVLDPQNVGNIIRTCHFYNVTAIAIATNTCAPLSSSALAKASSGACEAIPLFAVPRPSDFIYQSARAGWRIYASVAPSGGWGASAKENAKAISTADVKKASPLAKRPTILMLGAEGEGLRKNLVRHADRRLSIMPPGGGRFSQRTDVGVDSLNVGTAAGVLLEALYTEPNRDDHDSRAMASEKVW